MEISNGYIDLTVASDRDTMIQNAFANIATAMPGWKPREGNLEVLLIEQFAEMASEAAVVAANVPLSIFEYYGSLIGISQNTGTQMVISTTWTLATAVNTATFFPAGTVANIQYGGVYYQFATNADMTIAQGTTAGTVQMTAVASGASYNSIIAGLFLQPLYYVANLSTIQITSIVTPATDAESTMTYLDRLANALTLYTPRPIVSNDFSNLAQEVTGVGRAIAFDNTIASVNQLPATVANPINASSSGWSAVNGATLANNVNGITVVQNAGSLSSFSSPASPNAAAGSSFLPFITVSTTAGATYTASGSNTIAVTNTGTVFPNSAGSGYIENTDGTLTLFTYTGSTTTTITGVTFPSGNTYASGALVGYAGPTAFNTTSPINTVLYITNGTNHESVFIKGVTVSNNLVGWSTSTLLYAYTTSSAITYQTAAGATTTNLPISANSVNMRAVAVVGYGSSIQLQPVLVATVTYKDNTVKAYYSPAVINDISAEPLCLEAVISGVSPSAYTGAIADSSIPSTFALGASSVTLTLYFPGPTSSTAHNIKYVTVYDKVGNTSFYKDGAWRTGSYLSSYGTNNPSNIIPDAQFNSVYAEAVTTKLLSSATISSTSSPSSLSIDSTGGWAPSGAGVVSDGNGNSAYFFYTSITNSTTLGGVTWSSTAVTSPNTTYAAASAVQSLNPKTAAQMWKIYFATTAQGSVNPLPGVGVQFVPSALATTTTELLLSDVFALPAGTYFLDATIDAVGIPAGTSSSLLPHVEICYASDNSEITNSRITAVANQKTRNNATPTSFTVASNTNGGAYARISFPSGMPVSTLGQSIIISNLQLIPLTGSLAGVTNNFLAAVDSLGPAASGPTWTPGGYSVWNSTTGTASGDHTRSVTVAVTDPAGLRPTSSLVQSVKNYLKSYREVNFHVDVVGPTYQIIDVAYSVNAAKGYDPATVQASILANLKQYLSPTAWAGGFASPPQWDYTQGTIHYLDVIGRIDDADGVANVVSVQIGARPISGSTTYGTTDITFGSLACLPILGSITATVNSTNSSVLEVA